MILEKTRNDLIVASAQRHPEHELVDICSRFDELETIEPLRYAVDAYPHNPSLAHTPTIHMDAARSMPEGAGLIGGGRILRDVPGMGKVYDWRGTSWAPAQGGRHSLIGGKPILFVQHIPVVPNMAGIADFVRLRDVLVAQGLMVQNSTDRDGHVALFTYMDQMCYQARGANQISCGTEHMHISTAEDWTKHQLRASAWLINQALDQYSLPTTIADIENNGGHNVRVVKRGQTSHEREAAAAAYFDRKDPGRGYDWEYVHHCVRWYRDHNGSFVGA